MTLLGIKLRIERQLSHADDAVHWRPDFVTHVGQEGTARLVGGLGRLLGRNQGGLGCFDFADVALQDQHANRLAFSLAGGYGSAQQKPAPLAVARLEAAFGLKIGFLGLPVGIDPRLQHAQVIRVQHALPLRNRVVYVVLGVPQHLLPLASGVNGASPQIPVGQRIARQFGMPGAEIKPGVGTVG